MTRICNAETPSARISTEALISYARRRHLLTEGQQFLGDQLLLCFERAAETSGRVSARLAEALTARSVRPIANFPAAPRAVSMQTSILVHHARNRHRLSPVEQVAADRWVECFLRLAEANALAAETLASALAASVERPRRVVGGRRS